MLLSPGECTQASVFVKRVSRLGTSMSQASNFWVWQPLAPSSGYGSCE